MVDTNGLPDLSRIFDKPPQTTLFDIAVFVGDLCDEFLMLVCQSCHHLNPAHALQCEECELDLHRQAPGAHASHSVPHAQSSEDPMLGLALGNFRIDEKIARGGFGAVYRGTHTILEQPCAIKVLHFHQKDFETEARFKREAGTLAQLYHPNVVRMNDFGMLPTGGFYLVMELLEGATLFELFKQNTIFSLVRIKRLAQQMCDVLGYISSKGMVHRDLKPGNIFLVKDEKGNEQVKLIDFGIVSLLFSPDELTQTGAYLGTAKYGSPEQIRGVRQLDVRSDLYALGVVLYRMLTGRVPFIGRGGSVLTIIQQQVYDPPPTLASINATRSWAAELEAFFQKALAKPPEERYPTAEDFQEAFSQAITAQEAMLSDGDGDGVGEMTMLDAPIRSADFDPYQTIPSTNIPPSIATALREAKSTEAKREILRSLYEPKEPQGTRTMLPPAPQVPAPQASPMQVPPPQAPSLLAAPPTPSSLLSAPPQTPPPHFSETTTPSAAALPAVAAPSPIDDAPKPFLHPPKSPREAFRELSQDIGRTLLDVDRTQLSKHPAPALSSHAAERQDRHFDEADLPTDPGRHSPLPTPQPIQPPHTESQSRPPMVEKTVAAAINPVLAAQEALQRAEDDLFAFEPTALQSPSRLAHANERTSEAIPMAFDAMGDDKTFAANALPPDTDDPLLALLSQGDARIPFQPQQPIPWAWIGLGAGIFLIFLWLVW